jgi:hypothetical protein
MNWTAIVIIILVLIFWLKLTSIYQYALWIGMGYVIAGALDYFYYKAYSPQSITVKKYQGAMNGGLIPECRHTNILKQFENAPSGFKHEYMVRHMFNCFVKDGTFREVTCKDLHWLTTSDNGCLSLDGYNDKLKLAFEYQGIGHYHDVFHNNRKYILQRKNDEEKKQLCKNNGVNIIIIHYNIPFDLLSDYVKSRLYDYNALAPNIYYFDKYIPSIPEPPREMDTIIKKATIINRKSLKIVIYQPKIYKA